MNTGCPDCDRNFEVNGDYCPKCKVEYLKCMAETAQKEYEEAKAEYERNQNELSSSRAS